MTYSVGRLTVTTEPGSEFFVVVVGNGTRSHIDERDVDTFIVGAASSIPTTLESDFRLEDTTQSVFSDTTLPTSLNLGAFDRRRFEVYKIDTVADLFFEARIDTLSVLAIKIAIDIKPGSEPAPINPKSKGKIPVAILTTDTFDATTVNPATARFGATGTEAAPVLVAVEDVNGDGRPDLLLHFNTQDTGIQCGDTSASLTGKTFSGQAIQGSDSIQTVGCK
jgi:hypothetical protein